MNRNQALLPDRPHPHSRLPRQGEQPGDAMENGDRAGPAELLAEADVAGAFQADPGRFVEECPSASAISRDSMFLPYFDFTRSRERLFAARRRRPS